MVVINTMACNYADPYKDAIHNRVSLWWVSLCCMFWCPFAPCHRAKYELTDGCQQRIHSWFLFCFLFRYSAILQNFLSLVEVLRPQEAQKRPKKSASSWPNLLCSCQFFGTNFLDTEKPVFSAASETSFLMTGKNMPVFGHSLPCLSWEPAINWRNIIEIFFLEY
jgi:hypothetical protein